MFRIVRCPNKPNRKNPKEYDMYLVVFSDGHVCDRCKRKIKQGEQGLRSDKYDYDLCEECANKPEQPEPSAPPAEEAPDAPDDEKTGTLDVDSKQSQLKF